MKSLIALFALSSTAFAGNNLVPKSEGRASLELPPLPPLIDLGLVMSGETRELPVVGVCACHSPFASALMAGDRILSVDGTKVGTAKDIWRILGLARPRRSIEFTSASAIRLDGRAIKKKVTVHFPADWWLVESKEN